MTSTADCPAVVDSGEGTLLRRHGRAAAAIVVGAMLAVAIVAGLWLHRQPNEVEIIAASSDLPAGVTITDTMVFAQRIRTGSDPARFASRTLIESGAITVTSIPAGQVLLINDITPAQANTHDAVASRARSLGNQIRITAIAAAGGAALLGLIVIHRKRTGTSSRADLAVVAATTAGRRSRQVGNDQVHRSEMVRVAIGTVCSELSRHDQRVPRAAELSASGIEVLWTSPQPDPPRHWSTTNGGWSWHGPLPNQHHQHDRADRRTAIVSLGFRDIDRELFANLGTAHTLTVHGPPSLVTAYIGQLAASPHPGADDAASLLIIGDTTPPTGAASPTLGATGSTPVPPEPARRTRSLAPLSEPEDSPVETFAPVMGSVRTGEHIVIHDTRSATWITAGIDFDPRLEANVECSGDVPHPSNDSQAHDPPAHPPLAGRPIHIESGCDRQAPQPYDVLVRVLGEVIVEREGPRLTDAETELLVLLATVRRDGPINVDQLATMLSHDEWRTPKIRSIQARISNLRRKLGTGTDGDSLLPDSRTSPVGPSRYQLSPQVVTDVELIEQAHHAADYLTSSQARDILRHSLTLIRGKPYTARAGYSWAYDNHAAHRAVLAVTQATERHLELCTNANDDQAVRWTRQQLQRVIDHRINEGS